MKTEQYICDRCGKPVLITQKDKENFPRPWKMRVRHIFTTIWFQKRTKNETCDFMYDLCADCQNEFIDWWLKGKKDGEV